MKIFKTKQKRLKEKGLTLIDIIVAVAIFAIISLIIFETFTRATRVRRRITVSQSLRSQLQFAIEKMGREIRMMKDISDTQKGNNDSDLTFTNYNGETVTYCLSDSNGNCSFSGKFLARNGAVFTTSEIEIEELKFIVNNFDLCLGPQVSVTIYIKAKSAISQFPLRPLSLQTTISPRLYKYCP